MALNLIKVPTDKGGILISIAQIAFVTSTDVINECEIILAGGPVNSIKVKLSLTAVFDLANRRPPDGS